MSAAKTKDSSSSELINETITTGSHDFLITGYSLLKGLGVGKYVASDTFDVGGYKWAIYFYPDGKNPDDNSVYISAFIVLSSEVNGGVRAYFELKLLDQSGKEMHKLHSSDGVAYTLQTRGSMWGCNRFHERSALEISDFLKDDCLSLHCTVGVVDGQKGFASSLSPTD